MIYINKIYLFVYIEMDEMVNGVKTYAAYF